MLNVEKMAKLIFTIPETEKSFRFGVDCV